MQPAEVMTSTHLDLMCDTASASLLSLLLCLSLRCQKLALQLLHPPIQ